MGLLFCFGRMIQCIRGKVVPKQKPLRGGEVNELQEILCCEKGTQKSTKGFGIFVRKLSRGEERQLTKGYWIT